MILLTRALPISCLLISGLALGQDSPPAKLPLNALVVLTPAFCETEVKLELVQGKEKFPFGKVACDDLQPALQGAFKSVAKVEDSTSTTDADVILTPKFINATARRVGNPYFPSHEVTVVVEWTARDKAGKAVWVETVQGSAKHKVGNKIGGRYNKNLKLVLDDATNDMAGQLSTKLLSSPELRKLAIGN